jgi:hypothetical protein
MRLKKSKRLSYAFKELSPIKNFPQWGETGKYYFLIPGLILNMVE